MGASTMGMLRVLLFVSLMGVCALAQSPTYGVGRTPTPEELRAWDISIGPTGEELPPGRGTTKEGAQIYRALEMPTRLLRIIELQAGRAQRGEYLRVAGS